MPLAQRRRLAVAIALSLSPFAVLPANGAPAAEPATLEATLRHYDLPPGTLGSVLGRFAAESGLILTSEASLTTGKQSPGLRGDYTVPQALQRLLGDSGLAWRIDEGVLTLHRAPQQGEAVSLAPVVVEGARDGSRVYAPTPQEEGYRTSHSSVSGFREKPILDTPFSVTAFSAEVMRDQQAKSLLDVTKNDPSISQAASPLWYDRVNIRGFYLGVDAIQRDGLSINDQGFIALENKAAVEVVKGLSALRYGATSPGGVINYVVKRPTDTPLARVTLDGNDHGGKGLHGDFGTRFGADDRFGVRVNLAREDVRVHVDEIEGDKQFFSSAFDWRVNDRLLVELDYEYQDREQTAATTPSINWFDSLAEARAFYTHLDAQTHLGEKWAKEPNRQEYYGARVHYQLSDDWKVQLAGQRGKLTRSQKALYPYSLQPNGDYDLYLYYSPDQERTNEAWRVVFEGDVQTGALAHELAVGYDQLRRDMTWPTDGFWGFIGTGNFFDHATIADPGVGSDPSFLQNRIDQQSVFIADTVSYSDWLQVYGGLRRTRLQGFEGIAPGDKQEVYDRHALNPTVGLVVKPLADLSLYASYAEGIEQGGTAPVTAINRGEVMDPLESRQYEVGVKYQLANDALLTAAWFEIDKGLEYVDGANRYVQNGRQLHKGMEVTLSGNLSPRLRMIAGAAYLDARVEKTSNLALIGKRPQGVPEWQANLFADYDLSPWLPGLAVNGGVYYAGEKAIDTANSWFADRFARVDAGVRYRLPLAYASLATLRLNLENLTNERYIANTTWGSLDFGAPRTLKASVELDF